MKKYLILDFGNNKLGIFLFIKHRIYQIRIEEQVKMESKILFKFCEEEILNPITNNIKYTFSCFI